MAATATIVLDTRAGDIAANLSSIHWAWWDRQDVSAIAEAPVNKGTAESTDGSGVMTLSFSSSTLTSGQSGILAIHESAWTTTTGKAALLLIPVD